MRNKGHVLWIHVTKLPLVLVLRRFIKKLEHSWKALVYDGVSWIPAPIWHCCFWMSLLLLVTYSHVSSACPQDSVSVHRPGFYASRFLKFMTTCVFRKTHCKSAGWMASHMRESRTETENKARQRKEGENFSCLLLEFTSALLDFWKCVFNIKWNIVSCIVLLISQSIFFCLFLSPIVCYKHLRHMIYYVHECELWFNCRIE